jgi:hypothetical protein
MRAPIPHRIAPLAWRKPAVLWTSLGLAAAIGWPTALFYNDPGPQRLALLLSLVVFALALMTLGAAWAMGHAPRSRRIVVLHVVVAGTLTALAAPFLLSDLLALVGDGQTADASISPAMALAVTPLALLIGPPAALISGMMFAWIALTRGRIGEGDLLDFRTSNVQPFS